MSLASSNWDLTVSFPGNGEKYEKYFLAYFLEGTTACGNSYGKTYYVSQVFKTFWIHTRAICQSYGMEIVSLETLNEANSFFTLCDKNIGLFEEFTHVGGFTSVGKSLDKWYWVNSGRRIDFPLKFAPNQPDFAGNAEFCMSVVKRPGGFVFSDVYCTTYYENKFICQKTDF